MSLIIRKKRVIPWLFAAAAVMFLAAARLSGDRPEMLVLGAEKRRNYGGASAEARQMLDRLSTEEKAAQLFMITPEQLTGGKTVTCVDEEVRQAFARYPVGGLIFFAGNLENGAQTTAMNWDFQALSKGRQGIPLFLSIDEEGGDVARIGNHTGFRVPGIPKMKTIGNSKDPSRALEAGAAIGSYLNEYGFNVDFAPVADVRSNAGNQVVKNRSFGAEPELVAEMVNAYLDGLEAHDVFGVPKHFPGHGATEGDSHRGFAYTNKTWAELEQEELIPFYSMVERKTPFLMVGHISLPMIDGDELPGSLSPKVIQGYLREVMGYDGIIVTDALNMGAINNYYSAAEAAVLTLEAGADIVLMPADFPSAYEAVLEAVRSGRIPEARLDASVLRILTVKMALNQ